MDKNVKKERRGTALSKKRNASGYKKTTLSLMLDLSALAVGFLFGGCHTVFGAYPLGLALVSALPYSVWFALGGSIVGSLTIGRDGIIYALICTLAVFLRVVIGGSRHGKESGGGLFTESILLRCASPAVCGFIAGIYEILLSGFSLTALAYALATLLLPTLLTPAFAVAFDTDITAKELLFGGNGIFLRSREGKERFDLALFSVSALVFVFFISLSLGKYSFFGIDLSLVFAAAATLFAAKRFGSLYALTVGFFASVSVSALYSVSFALLGLAAGALFPFGALYALVAGVAALCAFGVYAGGTTGLLSVLPESVIAAVIMYPAFKHLECERQGGDSGQSSRTAQDMVGTMALSYRLNKISLGERVEEALRSLSRITSRFVGSCSYSPSEDIAAVSELLSRQNEEVREARELDEEATVRAEEAFFNFGFKEGVIRVFGGRSKYLICACEDKDGSKISSPELKERLEEALGLKLSAPHFFRRGNMALMECHACPKYKVRIAKASLTGDGEEVSGDTIAAFESEDGISFALISDGMGSGERAAITSAFAADFLRATKELRKSEKTVLYMLNSLIRRQGEECAATLDLFSFDRVTAEASFFKAGAPASYIKRSSSVFRIRSDTMPIGVLSSVDAESIKAEVKEDDTVIMLSDGVTGDDSDAPWLIEYLSREAGSLSGFAEGIISLAKKQSQRRDDMSVVVIKIERDCQS